MKALTLFVSLFFTFALYSQKEANNWVFGSNAGVSWNTGAPVPFAGAIINQTEGVACISDAAGQLLFYSDGISVRNRMHQLMPNGTGLLGGSSSTQSAITFLWPGDSTKYFLFTTPVIANDGLNYSVIDMSLQGSLGDVVASSKNTFLYASTCEKLTAVKHANGVDVWVVSHEFNSNRFYSYLVTSAGVNTTPVVSSIGSVLNGTDALGYLRISSDGSKLANTCFQSDFLEVFDFNNATGIISNNFFSDVNFPSSYYPYGVEFSPSGRYLYLSGDGSGTPIYQYDLLAANILLSKTTVGTMLSSGGALQLAPDQKMYVADYTISFLHVINNPDQPGLSCNFQLNALALSLGASAQIGLPNFLSSYFTGCSQFNVSINAVPSVICANDSSQICVSAGFMAYQWSNGETTSCITENQAGNYKVTVTDNSGCTAESNVIALSVYPVSVATIATPTPAICLGDSAQICLSAGFTAYQWNNGETTSCITENQAGNYKVTATDNNGCTAESNLIALSIHPVPVATIATPTPVICPSDSAQICISAGFTAYQWNNGETTGCITENQTGNYHVTATDNNGCTAESNVIALSVYPVSVATITNLNPVICSNDSSQICVFPSFTAYQWNNGATDSCITTRLAGNYYLTVTDNNGCTVQSNRVALSVYPAPPVSISVNGDTLTVYGVVTQQWYRNGSPINNATLSTYIITQGGSYTVTVIDTNGCRATSSPIIVSGIGDMSEEDGVSIYPTPFRDKLNVSINSSGQTTFSLYNFLGQQILRNTFVNFTTINTEHLADGIYFYELRHNGGRIKTGKVLKQ
ncbi:MAG: T9SS type A sorting domain-containing protein [Bacteroidota bacterium]